ncbi:THAUMATIN-LIKE PROTEIN 1B [Salix purpurea]|uniref:THAUMATIN-LIKE PROTEIN 1B n=1 Tax=Salix purpurea TaxID=77065 RepID=A0A9Q1A2I2_SALPP|nr:THAUMATIN-LIKE PROTEIN 1B [Salix purpurea]
MDNQIPLSLTFTLLLFCLKHAGAQTVTFSFKNNCPFTVWPANLNNADSPQLSLTGFTLTSGKFTCATGDCASGRVECHGAGGIPPASLAEFTLKGNDGRDFYDISLVDGFNIPLSVIPQAGPSGCPSPSCAANVNAVCDSKLAVKGSDGTVIACKSACLAFNQPQYCCTGEFGTPDKCLASNYTSIFKQQCPQAYSYAYDDKSSLFTCPSGSNYLITFCP